MTEKRCPCGFPQAVFWRCKGPEDLCEKLPNKVALPPGAETSTLPQPNQGLGELPDNDRPILVGGLVHPLRDRLLWGFLGLVSLGWGIGWIAGFIVGRWG